MASDLVLFGTPRPQPESPGRQLDGHWLHKATTVSPDTAVPRLQSQSQSKLSLSSRLADHSAIDSKRGPKSSLPLGPRLPFRNCDDQPCHSSSVRGADPLRQQPLAVAACRLPVRGHRSKRLTEQRRVLAVRRLPFGLLEACLATRLVGPEDNDGPRRSRRCPTPIAARASCAARA